MLVAGLGGRGAGGKGALLEARGGRGGVRKGHLCPLLPLPAALYLFVRPPPPDLPLQPSDVEPIGVESTGPGLGGACLCEVLLPNAGGTGSGGGWARTGAAPAVHTPRPTAGKRLLADEGSSEIDLQPPAGPRDIGPAPPDPAGRRVRADMAASGFGGAMSDAVALPPARPHTRPVRGRAAGCQEERHQHVPQDVPPQQGHLR